MVAQTHPFKVIEEKTIPWPGVNAPNPHSGPMLKSGFADGGVIGEVIPSEPPSGPVVSSGGVRSFAKGGKIDKKADKQTSGTKDLTAATAGTRLKGRALQLANAERKAEGLPPLKQLPE